jgi:hypothetical protein
MACEDSVRVLSVGMRAALAAGLFDGLSMSDVNSLAVATHHGPRVIRKKRMPLHRREVLQ